MVPGKYNITIFRGSTWSISIGAVDANGVAVNFDTDYIDNPTPDSGLCRMSIRPAWKRNKAKIGITRPDTLLDLTIANGRIAVSGETITLTISAADTADLDFNEGSYDIELVTGAATPVVDKILYGSVTVKDEITG